MAELDELSFGFLSDDEKKLFLEAINKLQSDRQAQTVCKQVRNILPFSDWVNDEFYSGFLGKGLYNHWKRVLTDVFDNCKPGEECNELIITGGLGTGKSTAACCAAMYKLYQLSCYENLAAKFGLIPGSIISEFYFSVSRSQAELTGWGVLKNYIDATPYFNDYFQRNQRLNSIMTFPESVLVVSGSDQSHCIGMNVILAILDEANFRTNNAQSTQGGQNNEKVRTFYASLLQRGKSRFLQNGVNHSMMILVSSNTTESSFTDYRIQQTQGDPHTKVINCRLWDVKPKGTYSDHGFWVFQGNQTYDAQILESIADLNTVAASMNAGPYYGDLDYIMEHEVSSVVKDACVWVPDDFKKQFHDEIYMALQDVAGVSVAPSGRLFNNRQAWAKATLESGLTSPFTKPYFILSTGDKVRVTDYIDRSWRPLMPDKPRFWHYDQSTSNDRTGFAQTYIERWEKDPVSGQLQPYFVTDVIGCIIPPKPPNQLSIRKCADILFIMRDHYHLPITTVTYDQFASAGIIQDLVSQGFNADRQSVDRTADAYLLWVEAILDGRWRAPWHPIVEAEIFNLVLDRSRMRVDHTGVTDNSNPLSGTSKDVCDAIAGSIMNAYTAGCADQEVQYRDVSTGDDIYLTFDNSPFSDEELFGGHNVSQEDQDFFLKYGDMF